jgi:hypothetical protein
MGKGFIQRSRQPDDIWSRRWAKTFAEEENTVENTVDTVSMYCSPEFFDTTTTFDTAFDGNASTYYYQPTYWYPYPWNRDDRIELTMDEAEHLRKMCLNDERLRATMQKFVHMIEVKLDV